VPEEILAFEVIMNTIHQGGFLPYHHHHNIVISRKFGQHFEIGNGNVYVGSHLCRSGVAGRHKYFFAVGTLAELPGQRMFTPA
jgi:hypothetical protein